MEKHIFKTIWNERRSNIALLLELFLISLFLWYVVDIIYPPLKTYLKPLGYNVEDVYLVTLNSIPKYDPSFDTELTMDDYMDAFYTLVERIKKHPDIDEVGLSIHGRPESNMYFMTTIWADTLKLESIKLRSQSSEAARLYQIEEEYGDHEKIYNALERGEIVVSASVAKELGPNPIGTEIYENGPDEPDRVLMGIVGAIAKDIRDSRFTNYVPFIITQTNREELMSFGYFGNFEINVKPKPGRKRGFEERLSKDLTEQLKLGNLEFSKVESLQAAGNYAGRQFERQMLMNGLLVLFLLANILLGISGVFWYRTQKRKSQMGLRVALGDTPRGVLRLYYKEGLLIFSSAFVLSIAVFVAQFKYDILNTELEPLDATRFVIGMVITYLVTAAVIILSIWLPARHILRTPPADTLKEE